MMSKYEEIEFTIDEDDVRVINAVRVENVKKSFGFAKKHIVLHGVNLNINKGEMYGLIGPSGCGKTTLLKLITGLFLPDSGSIEVFGNPVGSSNCRIPGDGVGYMPQDTALYSEFTVKETLLYFGRIFNLKRIDINERTTFLLNLLHLSNESAMVKTLSGGQKRRLSFAISLIQNAPLLILDEPTVGVDPLLRQNIWNHLETLVQTYNTTIIVTTHYIDEVQQTNMVGLMRDGYILDEDTPENYLSKYHCSHLEDVFIKLCETVDQEEQSANFVMNDLVKRTETVQENGVAYKPAKKKKKYPKKSTKKSSSKPFFITSHRTLAMAGKNWTHLIRNFGSLLIQFILPTLQLATFCYSLGYKPRDLAVGTVVDDASDMQFAEIFFQLFDNRTVKYDSLNSSLVALEKNEIWGLLYIPSNFSSNLLSRVSDSLSMSEEVIEGSRIKIWFDEIDQKIIYTLRIEIITNVQKFLSIILKKYNINPAVVEFPASFETHDFESDEKSNTSYMVFLAPGLMILISYYVAVALTNLSFLLERKQGLLERIYIAGVHDTELVLGFCLTQGFVMLTEIGLTLVVMMAVFKVPCNGPLFYAVLILLLQGWCGLFQGLMVSAITDDDYYALFLEIVMFFPNIMLTGCFWPTQAMSKPFQIISNFLPQTFAVRAFRAVLFRGWGIEHKVVRDGIVTSLVWLSVFITLVTLILRRRRKTS